MGSKIKEKSDNKEMKRLEKSYFDVLGLCCSSEVPLIQNILKPIEGIKEVSVIVPSRTVIVLHDNSLISQEQIVKVLNQARLEANVRVKGKKNHKAKWPSPYVMLSGLFLGLSFLKYVYHPLEWLAIGAVVVGVLPVLMRGYVALRNFTLDVNILMLIAVMGTIMLKDYIEAGTIVFLFTIAEWLESRASHKATAVMSLLLSMTPQKATIAETGEVVNVEDVKLNTVVAVKSGEMIPVDGIVVDGTCEVDEKTLTGESYPVPKQKDSTVWAGTVNVNGYISVKTTALVEDSAVSKMARLVEDAQNSRSNVQRLIDTCAKYYTPAVVLISLGLAVIPAILKVHNLRHWFYLALVVLVSACPCGLILSTPVATFCALSRAATSGLLIKGGDYLETLAKIKTIGFDKTGTITRGEFTVVNFSTLADDVSLSMMLHWVSSVESKSSHPIATVLVDYGRSQSVEPKPDNVEEFQNFPGEGVFGKMDGRNLYIGNKKLAQRANCNIVSNVGGDAREGATSGYVYSEGVVVGTFSLSDNCRSGAIDAVRELKAMGIRTVMLTGDNQSAAMHAQEELGQSLDFVHSELLPEDKASIMRDYKKHGPTAMVGDGVNDAPALATADVGISMGVSGSALATETGHIILMSNDIRKIPKAIKLARKTRRKVIENIFISIFVKACVLALAIAWKPLVWLAVLADVSTCLIVIFNSMLLLCGGQKGHEHGRKWFGLFSCHSRKSKCHSAGHAHSGMDQDCCSKKAPSCKSSHEGHDVKKQQCRSPSAHKISESSRCLLHDGSNIHSGMKQECCSKKAPTCKTSSKCLTMKTQKCCPTSVHIISESSRCVLQDCSNIQCGINRECCSKNKPSCQTSSKFLTVKNQPCGQRSNAPVHERQTCSIACEGKPSVLSNSPKKDGLEYNKSTCCDEDHCLEALESQISCESDKRETLSGSNNHLSHNEHHHGKDDCCNNIDQNTSDDYHKEKSDYGCTDHCSESQEIHAEHHHMNDGHGRASLRNEEAKSCRQSYRKRCCSSEGHFVSGGLTDIVTE